MNCYVLAKYPAFCEIRVTHIALRMQLDEILFALEAQLSNFRPRKGVNLGVVLEDKHPHVCNSKIQGNTFMILK